MDYESILTGLINSRLTKEVNKAKQAQEREDRSMPNSTRRAFESRMKTDAAVARVAAQNMEDGKAMVNVAQTTTTAIKSQLQSMREILVECAKQDSMTLAEYEDANNGLAERAKEIEKLISNASFNGMKLMDGTTSSNVDGNLASPLSSQGDVLLLQAGNYSREQKFMNLKDSSVGSVLGSNSMDLSAQTLMSELKVFDNGSTTPTTTPAACKALAETALDKIDTYIEAIAGLEAQYSYDYKSLDNLSMLLEEQADIYTDAAERSAGNNPNSLSSSAILSQLLNAQNASILSGNA